MSLNPLRPISIGQESLPSPLPWDSTARFCVSSPCCMNESPRQTLNVPEVEPWREGGCHLLAASERTFFTSLETIQIHKALPLTVSALQHYAWPCVCVCLSVCIHAFHQLTSHAWWVKMSHLLRFQCESVALHSWNQCWSFNMHTLFFIFFLL